MVSLQIQSSFPIANPNTRYEGITYDGSFFYLTVPKRCQIHKYDCCFHEMEPIPTYRGYSKIAYDESEDCFWAITSKDTHRIFKLNYCFDEIDVLLLKRNQNTSNSITGISPSISPNRLCVSLRDGIAEINKNKEANPILLQKALKDTIFTTVQTIGYQYLCTSIKKNCQTVSFFSNESEELLECYLPSEYFVNDITAFYSNMNSVAPSPCIYVLATKNFNYPYILKCSFGSCENELCCCKPVDCMDSCAHILESIAHTDFALAHILHAEAEKFGNHISNSTSTEEFIRANQSLNNTITNMTHIEQVLYEKLQAITKVIPNISSADETKCDTWEEN